MDPGGSDSAGHAEFIGRVGHELRTPLNAILGFSTLLRRETNLTERQKDRLATIEQSGRQLLACIERLLSQADIRPGRYPFDGRGTVPAPRDAQAKAQTSAIKGCVLVVDDTPANVELLEAVLQEQGMDVMTAPSGQAALARVHERVPDLILLDVEMPGLSGFETCAALKADARTRDVPVIFTTAISDTATKVAAFEAGAADYVTKPFHVDEALARVNTQLRLVHSQKQLARLNAELESRVAERTEQLESAIRELQSLCYSMAHDLRGPLGALDGFSALLEGLLKDEANERTRHYLRRIRAGVKQMDALTEALLTLAHLSLREPRDEEVDLGALAREALAARQAGEPSRQVKVAVGPGLVVRADRGLARMLVEQLVDNAWKFSAREAQAEISFVRHGERDGRPVFRVSDNGTGFDMAYADKLFRPFQRLHESPDFPGLGVGLAIAERIARRHGGQVWAEAIPGDGAAFYFTLGPG